MSADRPPDLLALEDRVQVLEQRCRTLEREITFLAQVHALTPRGPLTPDEGERLGGIMGRFPRFGHEPIPA